MACASTDNCTHADHRIILSALRHLRRNQWNLKSTWNPRNIYILLRDIVTAQRILRACGLRRSGVNLISCPTCGRTAYDMIPLAEELERRLTARGTDTPEKIQKRLIRAQVELEMAGDYDYFVVNDTVENAVNELRAIMCAEHCKPAERMCAILSEK